MATLCSATTIPQLLQRVALRSLRAAAPRSTALPPRLSAPTRSFLTASQPLFARKSTAESATKEKTAKTTAPRGRPKKAATKKAATKKAATKKAATKKPKAEPKAKPPKPKKAKQIIVKLRDLPPKCSIGPTALFVREYFETHPKAPSIEQGKDYLVGAISAYNLLDAAGKQRYADRSKELWEEHRKALEEWYRNTEPEKLSAIRKYLKEKGRRLPPNPARKPHPGNNYSRFTSQYNKDHPGLPALDMIKAAALEWKTLSEEEKARYNVEASKVPAESNVKQAEASSSAA